uniref:Uncharacterized protein n=1 Tax=Arundo donax TaxID=35708 RepID=A0A0A8YR22_ARUDO
MCTLIKPSKPYKPARHGVGLVGVVLLEVDAEGRDIVVLVEVGAGNLRPGRLTELQCHLHLHVPAVLHLDLLHAHPWHIVDVAKLRCVEPLGGDEAQDLLF